MLYALLLAVGCMHAVALRGSIYHLYLVTNRLTSIMVVLMDPMLPHCHAMPRACAVIDRQKEHCIDPGKDSQGGREWHST